MTKTRLSDKRFRTIANKPYGGYYGKDVKEFVDELKKETDKWIAVDYPRNQQKPIGWNNAIRNFQGLIDELAGDL